MEKCAEVLGLDAFDSEVFHRDVVSIDVPADGVLIFELADHSKRTVTWVCRSRSESWTDEMRQDARAQAKNGGERHG